MESLYTLFAVCGFIFLLFAINEVVKLKKEVSRLKGITDHLLKESKAENSPAE
ncbi:MAG: hypothetical protein QGF36_02385 [Candidatus Marinimicrobia bacterium]|nr:hypothetical protein [Candidatus Neomarinimicrobiota bacterium]MDP6936259.1 hypothetical protein [Candidatus Neomarinimicrobiota bacterium]